MTTIVFSKNSVRRAIGIVMRYSIRDEFPTVVALIIIDPIKEKIKRKLNKVAAVSMLMNRNNAIVFHPMSGATHMKPMTITAQITITPTG